MAIRSFKKYTTKVIRDATLDAIDILKADAALDAAPRIDQDTLGISGSPEIAATIFRKIRMSGVFLADISLVGENTNKTDAKEKKLMPNANVLLELGYAAAEIGWDRIIMVMNAAYGSPDELIFDLKHRRHPITFNLGPVNKDKLVAVQHKLAGDIAEAIQASLVSEYERAKEAVEKLDLNCLIWMKDCGRFNFFLPPERANFGEIVAHQHIDSALPRLIALGLLKCDVQHGGRVYAYHWTYLGKQVLVRLGLRIHKSN